MKAEIDLVMIVKNEEETLVETLRSARSYCDGMAIADTGSTDGTTAILEAASQFLFLDDVWATLEFCDFAQARNAALQFASGDPSLLTSVSAEESVFIPHPHLLMLSGGEILEGDPDAFRRWWGDRVKRPGEAFELTVEDGDLSYRQTRIFPSENAGRPKGSLVIPRPELPGNVPRELPPPLPRSPNATRFAFERERRPSHVLVRPIACSHTGCLVVGIRTKGAKRHLRNG